MELAPTMAVGSPCKVSHSSTPQGTDSISYQVVIREVNNPVKSFHKQILVCHNPLSNTIEIRLPNNPNIYELISVFRHATECGTNVEVSLRGKKTWLVTFPNLFQTF